MGNASLRLIGILFIITLNAINGKAESNTKNGSKLFGTVKSAQGEVLTGVNITISGHSFFKGAVSDIDGKYEIAPIPAGEYTLKATFIGFKPIEFPITIDGDQYYNTNLKLNTDNLNWKIFRLMVSLLSQKYLRHHLKLLPFPQLKFRIALLMLKLS